MPSYKWNHTKSIYTRSCSCCKTEVDGTADEETSVAIFKTVFSNAHPTAAMRDNMQARCYICNTRVRRQLGITLEWLRDMMQAQEGCCDICGIPISLDRSAPNPVNVDHDERNGKVRQLLCGNCNRGLGSFFHNIDFLKEAIAYLEYFEKAHSNE